MAETKIVEITKGSPWLDRVQVLFKQLYQYMQNCGILMPLVENGDAVWRKSIEKIIDGRFGILKGATIDEELAGFVTAITRFAPDYLGGKKVGYISHLYINPSFQKSGIGRLLVHDVEIWLKSKNVQSLEIQVLTTNLGGIEFWEKVGYKKELIQMRKCL
jgi:GNAT superfamily N-acetyltransferase